MLTVTPPQVSLWPPRYWWMRWWSAKYWSGIAASMSVGSPGCGLAVGRPAGEPECVRRRHRRRRHAVRLGGPVEDGRRQGVRAGVDAGDVAAVVQPLGPGAQEGAGRRQAGGVGVRVRLHVEVDRVAAAEAERVELHDRVVRGGDALRGSLGGDDLVRVVGAGGLQTDVRRDQGPALRDGLGHPAGVEVGLLGSRDWHRRCTCWRPCTARRCTRWPSS